MSNRTLIFAVTAVASLALAGSAQGSTTIIAPVGSTVPYQRWVDEAKVPTPDVTLTVVEESCEGAAACTSADTDVVNVGPMPFGRRHAFLHELGHRLDYLMPEWVRIRYMAIVGLGGAWRQPEALHYSPHEMFAESYALCARRPKIERGGGVDGEEPIGGWRTHNRVCRLIVRAFS